jgi:hypothetical protein
MDEKVELGGYAAQAGLNQPNGARGQEARDITMDPNPLCLNKLSQKIFPDS